MRISIDTGGTFTDALARGPDGEVRRAKVLSTGALRGAVVELRGPRTVAIRASWQLPRSFLRGFRFRLLGADAPGPLVSGYDPSTATLDLEEDVPGLAAGLSFEVTSGEEAATLAARILAGVAPGSPVEIEEARVATTLGTNALLTRKGAPTALFVTRGFADVLAIGTQQRPDLFAIDVIKPDPLGDEVIEVSGRLAADGSELEPVDEAAVEAAARGALGRGIVSAAIALMHSTRNPKHERRVETALRRAGFAHVSRSSEIAAAPKLLLRAETAVADACLAPVVGRYLERVRASLTGGPVRVMTSAGGLVPSSRFRPKDSLQSGPAGGVVGAAVAAARSGLSRIIAFDMGGTSTDVSRVDGDLDRVWEHGVGAARVAAQALAIETVAAGGGSICWFDGDRLRVGPDSAGASPGPACYGAGGPLTLTDVNLLLGRLDPERFEIPIVPEAASRALAPIVASVGAESETSLLEGFLAIANERMAEAIRQVSVRRGYDPAGHALVAFGGAGGQHACAVASLLGIDTILVPADAGLLSAFGLQEAAVERFRERHLLAPLAGVRATLAASMEQLVRETLRDLEDDGVRREDAVVRRRIVDLRLAGQESSLSVEWDATPGALERAFSERYAAVYGHAPEQRPLEVVALRAVASRAAGSAAAAPPPAEWSDAHPAGSRRVFLENELRDVPVYARETLAAGSRLASPCLVFDRHGATLVERAFRGEIDGAGGLVLRRGPLASPSRPSSGVPAVRLELFTNRLRAIAAEMGERLERTAVSTNVKERLDFSCGILDEDGGLVVNAPHIPVHLGALSLCVRRLAETIEMAPGDVVVTNHPAFGGSHLPDVTVVSPVHTEETAPRLLGYVASRAHHAELGGSRPGSMPPSATRLIEEGVVLPPLHLVRRGEALWDGMRARLGAPPFPSRAIEDNLADLRAAVAANHAGAEALRALAAAEGRDAVARYMRALQDLSARKLAEAIAALPSGAREAEERLDDGSALRARIEIAGSRAVIDFAGSAPQHPGNLNATPAVVRSAVLYVLRLLVREPLPLNEGLLRGVEIRIPPGMLNPRFPEDPAECPAVVGGNVETSQRLVDTLLKALGLAACSQGTMNNVVFGDARRSYYETVCGGSGATPRRDGASAVHTHMTNTRITDPEVLEHRYPVRLERFAVRRGSGGAGHFRGGDGTVREIVFLEPMSLSVLTQHRTAGPYGLAGGSAGAVGSQVVVRASGERHPLAAIDSCEVAPGDRLILETPGGGGFGRA